MTPIYACTAFYNTIWHSIIINGRVAVANIPHFMVTARVVQNLIMHRALYSPLTQSFNRSPIMLLQLYELNMGIGYEMQPNTMQYRNGKYWQLLERLYAQQKNTCIHYYRQESMSGNLFFLFFKHKMEYICISNAVGKEETFNLKCVYIHAIACMLAHMVVLRIKNT